MPEALNNGSALAWSVLIGVVASVLSGGAAWKILRGAAQRAIEHDLDARYEKKGAPGDDVLRASDADDFARMEDLRALAKDVDGLGGNVTAALSQIASTRDRADTNADAIIRLQEADRLRWEPVAEALEQIGHRMGESEKTMAKVTTLLDEISKRLDRHESHGRE